MNMTLAAASNTSRRTLYNWIRWGYLPYTEPRPRRRQVQLDDVLQAKALYYKKVKRMQITKEQIATLERITRAQNNLLIPLSNEERDQMHALLRTLRADEEGGS